MCGIAEWVCLCVDVEQSEQCKWHIGVEAKFGVDVSFTSEGMNLGDVSGCSLLGSWQMCIIESASLHILSVC